MFLATKKRILKMFAIFAESVPLTANLFQIQIYAQ